MKVGGSLLGDGERLRRVLAGLADGNEGPCIVVPGGGPDADAVRAAQCEEGFSDAEAHRRALDAMSGTASRFRAIEPRLAPTQSPWDGVATETALVWDPADLKGGHPDIPETWDVTSDSLALWLATRMRAPACFLVKSIEAAPGLDAEALSASGLVDAAFPAFARYFSGTIAIRGPGGTIPIQRRRAA